MIPTHEIQTAAARREKIEAKLAGIKASGGNMYDLSDDEIVLLTGFDHGAIAEFRKLYNHAQLQRRRIESPLVLLGPGGDFTRAIGGVS